MPQNFNNIVAYTVKSGFKSLVIVALLFLLLPSAFADITVPSSTATLSPSSPNGKASWYVTPVQITISATDLESGVKSINYKIDAGNWQSVVFANSLNVAPNPSFEEIDSGNTPIIKDWSASVLDADTTYTRDTVTYAPDYANTSAKIVTTGAGWHGINNQLSFATASPLTNMSASVKLKTQDVVGTAYFNVYVVSDDGAGNKTYTYVTSSSAVTGTVDWTTVSANFVANSAQAVGVYLDIGLNGAGTLWADAVSITNTNSTTNTTFTVGTNGSHTVEYYSVDNANNTEAHACPATKCKSFKIDQDPPGNWHDAGAIRGLFGSDHELYVYAVVDDPISGISTFTDKYQYHTEKNPGFGKYSNLLGCNSTWQPDAWQILISPPFTPGVKSAYVITPKTDFCNNNWKICKIVKFYAEDIAGNYSTKEFCLNGPWVSFTGGGAVRSNGGIDMVAEPEDNNSDGLIDVGNNLLSFFSSSRNWKLLNNPEPKDQNYDKWLEDVKPSPSTVTGLNTQSGVFRINGDFEIKNQTVPNGYGSNTFNQIVFVNGNLKISNDITVAQGSTALFIVKGNVQIDKTVNNIAVAIFADGEFFTAYNLDEGQTANTLNLNGVYVANKFNFQRTLQGTNNTKDPSEKITFEPKYAIKMATYLGANSIKWISAQ